LLRKLLLFNFLWHGVSFNWDDACEQAFKTINQTLTNPPTLRSPDHSKPVYIVCDGSIHGTAYAVYQQENKQCYPILFGGQALNTTQQRWGTLWCNALTNNILTNTQITILTDNSTLQHWSILHLDSMRMRRWNALLSQFNLQIVHIRGQTNPADGPSKMFAELDAAERSGGFRGGGASRLRPPFRPRSGRPSGHKAGLTDGQRPPS